MPLSPLVSSASLRQQAQHRGRHRARQRFRVSIYAGPSDFTQILGKLNAGDVVKLDFCLPNGTWCRVLHDGPTGWVLASFLIGAQAKIDATPGRSLAGRVPRPRRRDDAFAPRRVLGGLFDPQALDIDAAGQ